MLACMDVWVAAGFLLSLVSFTWCILYALFTWKSGLEEKDGDYRAEIEWEREAFELIERLP